MANQRRTVAMLSSEVLEKCQQESLCGRIPGALALQNMSSHYLVGKQSSMHSHTLHMLLNSTMTFSPAPQSWDNDMHFEPKPRSTGW